MKTKPPDTSMPGGGHALELAGTHQARGRHVRLHSARKERSGRSRLHQQGSAPLQERQVRHLFKTKEPLGWTLSTLHNLHFYLHLMQQARDHIEAGDFEEWSAEMIPQLQREAE